MFALIFQLFKVLFRALWMKNAKFLSALCLRTDFAMARRVREHSRCSPIGRGRASATTSVTTKAWVLDFPEPPPLPLIHTRACTHAGTLTSLSATHERSTFKFSRAFT